MSGQSESGFSRAGGIVCFFVLALASRAAAFDIIYIDYGQVVGRTSPWVFGAAQPTGLSDAQWDLLEQQGFTFARSQADLTQLVPCESVVQYKANLNNCADPSTWDWENGIYGGDFVTRAARRGMRVCLTIKNSTWNRWPGAPVDEETVPHDLEVWADVLRKIINHYGGKIQYVELYNEVDRQPQFLVEDSPWTREEGYKLVARAAIRAIGESQHPNTRVGGPAAALVGAEQVQWLLEDEEIRKGLGCLTFHDFDAEHYPARTVYYYKKVLQSYNVDLPVLRTSFVPEYGREGGLPGTIQPEPVARHLVGALKGGIEATGLWEIQNKSGADDVRYWFDGEQVVATARVYTLLSRTLGLGRGPGQVVYDDSPFPGTAGMINVDGGRVAVFTADEARKLRITLQNIGFLGDVRIQVYRGDAEGDGRTVLTTITPDVINNNTTFDLDLPAGSVFGLLITGSTEWQG